MSGFKEAQRRYDSASEGDDPIGPCPECGEETGNYEGKPRVDLEWLPCDECRQKQKRQDEEDVDRWLN